MLCICLFRKQQHCETTLFTARVQSKVADKAVAELEGKVLGADDYDVLLTGPSFITMNDGRPLACYLPGVLKTVEDAVGVYDILHPLYKHTTNNRGSASGTKRIQRGSAGKMGIRSDAMPVSSEILGAVDPQGVYKYCRLTAWNGKNVPQWEALQPFFHAIAHELERYVPQRYAAQQQFAERTDAHWLVPGTPFTTITVNNCVDAETECLTKRSGWTSYSELRVDDEILAYDPESDTTCWEQLRDLHVNPEYRGYMIKMNSRSFTALTTPDHRWPLAGRSTHKTRQVFRSEELPSTYWSFLRAAPHEAPSVPVYSDAFVRIAAWYFTEGSLLRVGTSVSVCQSDTHNPHHVDEIRRTLKELGAISLADWRNRICTIDDCQEKAVSRSMCNKHACRERHQRVKRGVNDTRERKGQSRRTGLVVNEYSDEKGDKITWVLTGNWVEQLLAVVEGDEKVPSMDFLIALTREQASIFVETCIKGDGMPERRAFGQWNTRRMDAYMTAAVLAGESPSANADGTYCALWSSRKVYASCVTSVAVPYRGVVWCPSVPSGHWVARRNGKVFLTGNSYSTGVHKDKGDLDAGFSALACLRRGTYTGGVLTFPQYRVGADMQDGDLMLMDAHQWHGNTKMICACGDQVQKRPCVTCGAERISVVCYYRTRMAKCGTAEEEYQRALDNTEKRSKL